MKTFRQLCIVFLFALINRATAEEPRIWTQAATGKIILGTLQSKSADNAEARIKMKKGGAIVPLKTQDLSAADQDYIRNWTNGAELAPPNREGGDGNALQGLILPPPNVLDQGKGGFGNQIDELGEMLRPYADPQNDLAPHPGVTIYSGPSPSGTGNCSITYLMPRDKAVDLLLGRAGLSMKLKAVAPGFPPGLTIYNYDRKFGDYDHLTLVVDDADQLVTLQFKSDTKAFGFLDGRWPIFNFRTLNYINLKTADGGQIQVRGRKPGDDPVVVNILHRQFKETVTWYVPKPLVRLILFNVQEKKKERK